MQWLCYLFGLKNVDHISMGTIQWGICSKMHGQLQLK